MIVCICNRISSRTIEAYAQQGLGIDALRADYGLASTCGQCLEQALSMIDQNCSDSSLYAQAALVESAKIAVG